MKVKLTELSNLLAKAAAEAHKASEAPIPSADFETAFARLKDHFYAATALLRTLEEYANQNNRTPNR